MVTKKYFYTDGVEKYGPFSLEELKQHELTGKTKVWYYGLENWTPLSEIEELNSYANLIFPKPEISGKSKTIQEGNIHKTTSLEKTIAKNKSNRKRNIKKGVFIPFIIILITVFAYFTNYNQKANKLYQEISSSAYDADIDFDFYVQKFYRDLEVFGIFPQKPKTTIIKFAKFDHITDATHIHGVSCGVYDDDRIEIYINPSTWEKFSKPKRYYLMYHELSHDVLNVDDLKDIPSNYGKLMYPVIISYESITMDDFIKASHELFDEIGSK